MKTSKNQQISASLFWKIFFLIFFTFSMILFCFFCRFSSKIFVQFAYFIMYLK